MQKRWGARRAPPAPACARQAPPRRACVPACVGLGACWPAGLGPRRAYNAENFSKYYACHNSYCFHNILALALAFLLLLPCLFESFYVQFIKNKNP